MRRRGCSCTPFFLCQNILMKEINQQLINHLSQFVTPERWETFLHLLNYRTRYITVVVEDVYQSHNASAVLRTCECFGIQDVHIIENKNEYTLNPDVALGSFKWLNLIKHNISNNNTQQAIQNLKDNGYRIVATTPHRDDVSLEEFDISKGKFALLFGTELNGLTDLAIENADEYLNIPMFGFTESFNISVSAAIILHYLSHQLRNSNLDWKLSKTEQEKVLLEWLRNSIQKVHLLEEKFLKQL